MVVMIHSIVSGPGMGTAKVVMQSLTQWAVPWFFFISGVFLRKSLVKYSSWELLRKKNIGLLLPYFLWQLIWYPVGGNPTLWFLQALILFTLCAIVCFVLKPSRWSANISLVALGGIFTLSVALRWGWFYGTPTSPFYFLAGLGLSKIVLQARQKSGWVVFVFVCSVAIGLRIVWFLGGFNGVFEMVVRNACVMSCVVALWKALDFIPVEKIGSSSALHASFFVYCFHYPPLVVLKNLWEQLPIPNVFVPGFLGFLLFSMLVPGACCILALSIARIAPRFYHCLSGGR